MVMMPKEEVAEKFESAGQAWYRQYSDEGFFFNDAKLLKRFFPARQPFLIFGAAQGPARQIQGRDSPRLASERFVFPKND
jgi:hypothetical protein